MTVVCNRAYLKYLLHKELALLIRYAETNRKLVLSGMSSTFKNGVCEYAQRFYAVFEEGSIGQDGSLLLRLI